MKNFAVYVEVKSPTGSVRLWFFRWVETSGVSVALEMGVGWWGKVTCENDHMTLCGLLV